MDSKQSERLPVSAIIGAYRAFKYRIYPNTEQKVLIAKHFGCSRHVYNWALSEKDKHYKETGKSLSRRRLQDRLVASKKDD